MQNLDHIRELEQALGFAYPPSFIDRLDEFRTMVEEPAYARFMPNGRVLLSAAELCAAHSQGLPDELVPFLAEENGSWIDFYAFDATSPGPEFRIVVFADHAAAMHWGNFESFLVWLRRKIAEMGERTGSI